MILLRYLIHSLNIDAVLGVNFALVLFAGC